MFSIEQIFSFIDCFARGSYELYFPLAVLGIILLIKNKQWAIEHSVLILLVLINAAIFYLISLAYRYFIVNIMLLMPFTIIGFLKINEWASKLKIKKYFMIAVFCIALFQIYNGMSNSIDRYKAVPKQAGLWISSNKSSLKNPENKRNFIIALFGQDSDICLFSDSTFTVVTNIKYMHPEEFIKGIPAGKYFYAAELIPDDEIIKPDIFIVSSPEDYKEIVIQLDNDKHVIPVKTKWDRDYRIYKRL